MDLKTIHTDKYEALMKWHEYKRAYNIHHRPMSYESGLEQARQFLIAHKLITT